MEDNAELRTSLAELLQSLGYCVEQAANGEEALAQLTEPARRRGAPVDLILSDMVMPRVGGVALLTALRRRGLAMPVILMSGHPLGEDIAALEQLGMAAWLDKPPGALQVARAIAGTLDSGT